MDKKAKRLISTWETAAERSEKMKKHKEFLKSKRICMMVLSEDEIRVINFAIHTAWGEMTEEEKIDASKALNKLNRAMESVGGDV